MKFLLVLILMILGAVAYFLMTPAKAPAPKPESPTEKVAKTDPSHHSSDGSTLVDNLNSAAGYATGYTQVKVKNKVAKKLDKIQADHNKALGGE